MNMKPSFSTQPHFHMRTPRVSQSMTDYASPVTRYSSGTKTERAGGVILAFVIGILLALALVHGLVS